MKNQTNEVSMAFNLKINVHKELTKKIVIMVLTISVVFVFVCKNDIPESVISLMMSMLTESNESADLAAFTDCRESGTQSVPYTYDMAELLYSGTQYSIVNSGSLNFVYNIN